MGNRRFRRLGEDVRANMPKLFGICLISVSISACQPNTVQAGAGELPPHLEAIIQVVHKPEHPYVLVEAHRGSHSLERPENSVPAIEHAIEIGADWIELDVALTKDNVLILMHDETLDRTTTLSGSVGAFTFAEIRASRLKRVDGTRSDLKAPSLSEALDLMAGRALFRLDLKCGGECVDQVYELVASKGLMSQAIYTEALRERALSHGLSDAQIIVVGPKIEETGRPDRISPGVDYVQVKDFPVDEPPRALITEFSPHVRMVMYPYSDERSGMHGDIRSMNDPDAGWGWLVEAGGDILLTDQSQALIAYLEQIGRRDLDP